MKFNLSLFYSLLFSVMLNAQSKSWSVYTSVEEAIHVSDIRPSYNYFNLSVPAGNAGMRMGAFYTHDENISAEITLGVIGISSPNRFSSGLIPIEVVGHYNVLPELPIDWLSKFNVDLGLGSSLAESSPGNFGFSEHMVLGATAELGNLLPFGTLMMGTRYTMFIDDFVDGYAVSGTGNDKILRFFTGLKIDLGNSNNSAELSEAKAKIDKLESDLMVAALAYDDLSAQKEGATSSLKAENAELKEKLTSLENSATTTVETTQMISEINGYHVVIGSFPNELMANEYLNSLDIDDLQVVFVESIPTYRVVLSEHKELREALLALENAMAITPNAWIAVY